MSSKIFVALITDSDQNKIFVNNVAVFANFSFNAQNENLQKSGDLMVKFIHLFFFSGGVWKVWGGEKGMKRLE